MSQRFQITRAAELESLQIFRDFINDCCLQNNITDDVIFDLKLAVDEACMNIITHGYKDMDPGSIILSFRIRRNRILVQITDFGYAFEPVETPKPDIYAALDDQELGGCAKAGAFICQEPWIDMTVGADQGQAGHPSVQLTSNAPLGRIRIEKAVFG